MMQKALAVGINHFLRPGNDLNGCIPDAREMQKIFAVLGITNIQVLVDGEATKVNALGRLAALVEEAKAGNLSYLGFSWSGHGTHYDRPEEADGLGEALVCYDIAEKNGEWDQATIIKDQELKNLLNQIPLTCVGEVWLDTCYSGGMDRVLKPGQKSRYLHNPDNPTGQTRVANVNMNLGLNANIILWAASSEEQESADAYIGGGSHGAFTYYWGEAFKANPRVSRVQTLVNTRQALAANGYDQLPRLKAWNAAAQQVVGS